MFLAEFSQTTVFQCNVYKNYNIEDGNVLLNNQKVLKVTSNYTLSIISESWLNVTGIETAETSHKKY